MKWGLFSHKTVDGMKLLIPKATNLYNMDNKFIILY